jgi:hypothetical protein
MGNYFKGEDRGCAVSLVAVNPLSAGRGIGVRFSWYRGLVEEGGRSSPEAHLGHDDPAPKMGHLGRFSGLYQRGSASSG